MAPMGPCQSSRPNTRLSPKCALIVFSVIAIQISAISSSDPLVQSNNNATSGSADNNLDLLARKQPTEPLPTTTTKMPHQPATDEQHSRVTASRPKLSSHHQSSHNRHQSRSNSKKGQAIGRHQVGAPTNQPDDQSTLRQPDSTIVPSDPKAMPQNQSPLGQAQEEMRRLMNTPPSFVTLTRDFFVDVARHQVGSLLVKMQAIDNDGDRIEYFIQPANYRDASPYFSINSTSGELRLINKQFQIDSPVLGPLSSSKSAEGQDDNDDVEDQDQRVRLNQDSLERPSQIYFLNVGAYDGLYPSIIELQIHVFNSTSFGTNSAVQLTAENGYRGNERIESMIRNKTNEFYSKLLGDSSFYRHGQTSLDNSTIVYPNFMNPSLTKPSDFSGPSQDQHSLGKDELEPVQDANLTESTVVDDVKSALNSQRSTIAPSSISYAPKLIQSPSQQSSSSADLWPGHGQGRFVSPQHQQVELIPQQMIMSLAIVAISFLIIVIVLLIFIVPLSVKRLRKRLKTVEMQQHEQLSQKTSNCGSSTVCSSSSGGSLTTSGVGGHLPSLSQFNLSDGSRTIRTSGGSSIVCRQSSLDSALTGGGATISSSTLYNHHHHHHPHILIDRARNFMSVNDNDNFRQHLASGLNRVNNGSIANPVYLHQHHQNQVQNQEHFLMLQNNQQQFTTKHPPNSPQVMKSNHMMSSKAYQSDEIYYPLDDEHYSTITTDSTTVDSIEKECKSSNEFPSGADEISNDSLQAARSMSGHLIDSRSYLGVQCAQPLKNDRAVCVPDGPESRSSSRSSTRSLTRFCSLPARRLSDHKDIESQGQSQGKSYLEELEDTFGDVTLKKREPITAVRTIARTINIERERQSRLEPDHLWELDRNKLKILTSGILGEGQFGLVLLGKLRTNSHKGNSSDLVQEKTVAVKMLKMIAAKDGKEEELLTEIEIMKLVCKHPNVVKLLHCCTSSKPILLIMEYAELGKLQSFLERSRQNHTYATHGSNYFTETRSIMTNDNGNDYKPMNHEQTIISAPSPGNNYSDYVTSRDLIKFIYHIAKGMEYISSQCIVHRDLASRNILINSERICKIGDFGMARHMQSLGDVYERHSRNTKIPVRWMAPEVLLKNKFTSKSDVFSFGILMWEIVTLGSTPYTHLKTEQVIEAVALDGERPSKPEYCHSELYNIMSKCWSCDPDVRPTFRSLVKQLDQLLLSANEYIELDQYPDHNYYNIPKPSAPYELL